MASDNALEVDSVTVKYDGLTALDDVTLAVPSARVTAVLGANGAGKSTLLNTISGVVKSTSGTIRHRGTPILGLAPHRVAKLGIMQMPEGRGIFSELTVEENLRLAKAYRRPEVSVVLNDVWEQFPVLRDMRHLPAGSLSGGQQQMLAIARAVIVRPDVLLVDELSFGLSPLMATQVFELLRAMNRDIRMTVLLVEQNVAAALNLAEYTYVLKNGKVVLHGASAEVLADRALLFHYLGSEATVS